MRRPSVRMATDRRSSGVSGWHGYLDAYRVRFLDELVELLRVPSVSSAPEHAADVERAAAWVVDRLTRAGLEHAAVVPTGGHPVAYADWLHAPGRPTGMLYGHFDVVPPGPCPGAPWCSAPRAAAAAPPRPSSSSARGAPAATWSRCAGRDRACTGRTTAARSRARCAPSSTSSTRSR